MDDTYDPLDEEALDPLDEAAMEPDEGPMPHGAGDDCVAGFGVEVLTQAERAARLTSIRPGTVQAAAVGKIVKKRKRAFLRALAVTGVIAHAAARAGWSISAARYHRETDDAFREAWDEAVDVSADLIEMAMVERGVHGVAKPIWDRGGKDRDPGILGYETVYSDSLLIQLAKARRPEKFRERHEVDHKGNGGGGVLVVPGMESLEDWMAKAEAQQAQYREKRDD